MKKIYLYIIFFCLIKDTKAQSLIPPPPPNQISNIPISFDNDIDAIMPPSVTPLSNCSRSSSDFAFFDDINSYIPNANIPVKTIQIAFNIFQNSTFSGNFQDTPADKKALLDMLAWINERCYRLNLSGQSRTPSDLVPGVTNINDSRIQFSLGPPGQERIYFYQDNNLQGVNCTDRALLFDAVLGNGPQADPIRAKYFNIFFVEGALADASGCSNIPDYGDNFIYPPQQYPFVVLYGAYSEYKSTPPPGNLWIHNIILRHELGHNLGLCHTYLGGGCPCSVVALQSSGYWYSDLFGPTFPGTAPHTTVWTDDAFALNGDRVTNNIIGGNKDQSYISPMQMGQMHKSLSLKGIRNYVDHCTYSPAQPIIISKDEFWDFDIRLYSDLIIQPGRTLDLACKITMPCNSKIHVMPGATLKMESGSEIIMNDNAQFLVDQGGILWYNNGIITLNGANTVLEIKGKLDLQPYSTFLFEPNGYAQGNGYIKFSSSVFPSDNIIAGIGSKIMLKGLGQTDKVLEITQESMYTGSLSSAQIIFFSITDGLVALANTSRLNINCSLALNNVKITSTTGGFNNHRGVHVYGQVGVSVNNCIFEYGKYGIFAALIGSSPLTINNSIFRYCTTGLYSIGKGVTLNSCQFFNNSNVGWFASAMSLPSTTLNSNFTQNISGIAFNNTGTGSLLVKNSNISSNSHSGIEFGGPSSLTVRCGSVSANGTLSKDFGILIHSAANLNMSTTMTPIGGTVSLLNNKNTISSNGASTINISWGLNDLKPLGGKALIGNVKNNCQLKLFATRNKWRSSASIQPVQNIDYKLTTTLPCVPLNIIVLDGSPSPVAACITPPPSTPLNVNTANPLDFCPGCPKITTASFNKVKYNDAVKQALSKMEVENPSGNDLVAVDMFYQILVFGTDKKTNNKKQDEVVFLNDIAYTKMKEALGNAFLTGRTSDYSLTNPAVQKLLAVQDSLIAEAKSNNDGFVKFYTSTDKAFVYRIVNLKEKTLELLDNISGCMAPDSIENVYLADTRKVANIEYLIFKGEVKREDFEKLLNGNISAYNSPSGINVVGDTAPVITQCVNQIINFRTSNFGNTYLWNFGNGNTATTANASTTYTAAGTYTVMLTVTGDCNAIAMYTSKVTIINNTHARFGFCTNDLMVTFHDSSSNALNYSWDFGDGNTSDIESPTHDYASSGNYSVCLTATNLCGNNTTCQNVVVAPLNQWTQKANFGGTARSGVTSFVIGNKAYMGTGYDDSNLLQDFWEYEPQTDTWTQKATFPGAARFVTAGFYFSVGDKGYFGTGWNGTGATDQSDLWEYNATLNSWTQKASFAGGQRNGAVGFSIGNKGYIGTGWNITDYPIYFHQDFWEYDPQTDTWTQKANFAGPGRQGAVGLSIGTKGYIGLGGGGSGSYLSTFFNDFWEYDQQSDTWTQKANLPAVGRQWAVGFGIGTKGYMGTGGTYPNGPHYADFWEWDQATDTWAQKADFGGGARNLASGFSTGTKGYLGTGHDGSPKNDFWEFDPAFNPCAPQLRSGDNTQTIPATTITSSATSVYPNPNNGIMTVKYTIPENQSGKFEIYNLIGVKVTSYQLQSGRPNSLSIFNADLHEGIYLYHIISNDKMIEQGKIVVIK